MRPERDVIRLTTRRGQLSGGFMRELIEKFWIKVAWSLPRTLVKWCFVRVATFKEEGNPGETKVGDAMDRWMKSAD